MLAHVSTTGNPEKQIRYFMHLLAKSVFNNLMGWFDSLYQLS